MTIRRNEDRGFIQVNRRRRLINPLFTGKNFYVDTKISRFWYNFYLIYITFVTFDKQIYIFFEKSGLFSHLIFNKVW